MSKEVKVELVKGEAFEIDPHKTYLLVIKENIDPEMRAHIRRLFDERGWKNVLVMAGLDAELVEKPEERSRAINPQHNSDD